MDIEQLKTLDSLLVKSTYEDSVFAAIQPFVAGYVRSAQQLRALPLGEVQPVTVVYGGGRR